MFNRTLARLKIGRRYLPLLLGLLLIIVITLHHIGSAPGGLSPAESAARAQSSSLNYIVNHPLNAPHQFALFAAQKISSSRHGILRLSSYLYALIFSLAFYYLAVRLFGKTVGLMSSLVFCLSPFFLIPARMASAEIMLFWPIALMAVYFWLAKTERKTLALIVLTVAAGLAFYTPGLMWWIIGGGILCRKNLAVFIGDQRREIQAALLVLIVILLIPAGLATFHDWHFLRDLAALPATWPGPLKLIKNLAWMVLALVAKTPYHNNLSLGSLPYLDLIQLGLLVFGGYALWTAARNKAAALGLSILLAIILAGINDNVSLLLLGLPAAGILMGAGLRYLYIEWRGVFPLNPIPKSLALLLMSALVSIQVVYGLSYSLVAWPHSPDTKQVFMLK